jgi:hypothetical protein
MLLESRELFAVSESLVEIEECEAMFGTGRTHTTAHDYTWLIVAS